MIEYILPAIALIAAVVSTGFAISAIRLARSAEAMAIWAQSQADEADRLVESTGKTKKKERKRHNKAS